MRCGVFPGCSGSLAPTAVWQADGGWRGCDGAWYPALPPGFRAACAWECFGGGSAPVWAPPPLPTSGAGCDLVGVGPVPSPSDVEGAGSVPPAPGVADTLGPGRVDSGDVSLVSAGAASLGSGPSRLVESAQGPSGVGSDGAPSVGGSIFDGDTVVRDLVGVVSASPSAAGGARTANRTFAPDLAALGTAGPAALVTHAVAVGRGVSSSMAAPPLPGRAFGLGSRPGIVHGFMVSEYEPREADARVSVTKTGDLVFGSGVPLTSPAEDALKTDAELLLGKVASLAPFDASGLRVQEKPGVFVGSVRALGPPCSRPPRVSGAAALAAPRAGASSSRCSVRPPFTGGSFILLFVVLLGWLFAGVSARPSVVDSWDLIALSLGLPEPSETVPSAGERTGAGTGEPWEPSAPPAALSPAGTVSTPAPKAGPSRSTGETNVTKE